MIFFERKKIGMRLLGMGEKEEEMWNVGNGQ